MSGLGEEDVSAVLRVVLAAAGQTEAGLAVLTLRVLSGSCGSCNGAVCAPKQCCVRT